MICVVCCAVLVQKVFFYRVFQQFPNVGWWHTFREDCYISFFCLHLVRHVLSNCSMSCFVLSSWSHIDFCGVVKLCTVVFVRVLVEHFERRLLYALFCVCCWCNRCFLRCCPLVYGLLCVLLLENCYLKCFLVILI